MVISSTPDTSEEDIYNKIGELFGFDGELRWLFIALVREKPLPMTLRDNPKDLTKIQILALSKANQLWGLTLPKNK